MYVTPARPKPPVLRCCERALCAATHGWFAFSRAWLFGHLSKIGLRVAQRASVHATFAGDSRGHTRPDRETGPVFFWAPGCRALLLRLPLWQARQTSFLVWGCDELGQSDTCTED